MAVLPTIDDELRQMRDRLSSLESQLLQQQRRDSALTFPRNVRPAMTWTENEEEYPSKSQAFNFPFVFCQAEFDKRSASEDGTAYFPDGYHLPRETRIYVLEDHNKYHILHAAFETIRFITLTSAMSSNEADFDWDDYAGGDTGYDRLGIWGNAAIGHKGRVQWKNNTSGFEWRIIDIYSCSALT